MNKALIALALLTTLATTTYATDRRNGSKKAARKTKTECPAKQGCCAGMKHCAEKAGV